MAAILTALGGRALLLKGCEGEAFADPQLRPEINFYHDGACESICAAQSSVSAVPLALRSLLAACLYAAGYTDDLNQARAITSINGFGRIAA